MLNISITPNLELIDRLINHYSEPGTAPQWTWDYCLGGLLQRWGLLYTLEYEELAGVLGLEPTHELLSVMLGSKFTYQAKADKLNRELILSWLIAVRDGTERPKLHTQGEQDAEC